MEQAISLQMNADARTLDITYYNGGNSPRLCVVDGIMIATISTPGRNLLRVDAANSSNGTFGVIEILDQKSGKMLRYIILEAAQGQLDNWNVNTTGRQHYDTVMDALESTLFSVDVSRSQHQHPR